MELIFLVMHWTVALSWLQLTQLIAAGMLCAVYVILYQRTFDFVIAVVKDHTD